MSDLDSGFYNIAAACDKLMNISEDCISFSEETGQGLQLANTDLTGMFIQKYESPSSWRLSRIDEASGINEIVEFRVQGVISDKLLPPVGNLMSNKAVKQCSHLRQAVSITGLGSSVFDNIVLKIREIFYMFIPYFPEDSLALWEPEEVRGYEGISTLTRLFTSRNQAPNVESVPFDPLVDLNNNLYRLSRLAGGKFIHTADNEVEYLGPVNGNKTGSVLPEIFRIGDIVDLSVSFVIGASGPDKYCMSIELKSVRLLDREETNNARIMSMIDNKQKKSVKLTVPKRKKTYTKEEETAKAQFKLFKMKIDKGPSPSTSTTTRNTDVNQEIS